MATQTKKKKIKLLNAAKRVLHRMNLREDVQYHDQPKVEKRRVYINDDGVGVVENVKILGYHSRNKNRRYAFDGIDPELYEGIPVNIDHPDPDDQKKPRDYISRFGWIEGVYKTIEGLFARFFYFNPDHCHAKGFMWWAKHAPDKIGFSQNAFGDVYDDDEGEVVDKVNDVRSIDLVADPATTKGIFEALEEGDMADTSTEVAKVEKKETMKDGGVGQDVEHDTDEDINIEKNAPIVTFEAEEDDFEDEVKKEESKESKAEEHKERLTEDDEEDMEPDDDDDDDDDDDAAYNSGGPQAGEEGEKGEGDEEETEGKGDEESKTLSQNGGPDIEDELVSACEKIFRDKKLPFKSKVKKIIHLLKLHHSGIEEAYMPKDLTDAKNHLLEKMGKDESARLVLEALDGHEVKDAMRAKRSTVKRLLKAASLPKEAITPYFERKLLEATDEREIQEMIEDRRAVTGPARSEKPRSAVGDALLLREGRPAGPEQPDANKKMTKEEREKAEESAFEKFEASVMG